MSSKKPTEKQSLEALKLEVQPILDGSEGEISGGFLSLSSANSIELPDINGNKCGSTTNPGCQINNVAGCGGTTSPVAA